MGSTQRLKADEVFHCAVICYFLLWSETESMTIMSSERPLLRVWLCLLQATRQLPWRRWRTRWWRPRTPATPGTAKARKRSWVWWRTRPDTSPWRRSSPATGSSCTRARTVRGAFVCPFALCHCLSACFMSFICLFLCCSLSMCFMLFACFVVCLPALCSCLSTCFMLFVHLLYIVCPPALYGLSTCFILFVHLLYMVCPPALYCLSTCFILFVFLLYMVCLPALYFLSTCFILFV